MCLSAILQSLYNLLWGSPPPKQPQQAWQDPGEQPAPYDETVMGKSAMGSSTLLGLRFRANAERAQMIESFQQSHQAQSQRDKAAAKKRAMIHQRNMEKLNKQASEQIFSENNKRNRPGIVDLHGLHVEEAITFTERAIHETTERGGAELRLIVGQGRHSEGGMPKLKPAIEKHLQQRRLVAKPDPKNPGILIVQIGSE